MRRLIAALLAILLCLPLFSAQSEEENCYLNVSYNARKMIITVYYSDADGNKIQGPDGYAQVEYQYEWGKKAPFKV